MLFCRRKGCTGVTFQEGDSLWVQQCCSDWTGGISTSGADLGLRIRGCTCALQSSPNGSYLLRIEEMTLEAGRPVSRLPGQKRREKRRVVLSLE